MYTLDTTEVLQDNEETARGYQIPQKQPINQSINRQKLNQSTKSGKIIFNLKPINQLIDRSIKSLTCMLF